MLKRKSLNWVDVIVLTSIFFGMAIYSSTIHFFTLSEANQVAPPDLNFGSSQNWSGIAMELGALCVAWLYLQYRQFDFKILNFNVNKWTLPKIVLYILLAGSVATAYEIMQQAVLPHWYPPADESTHYSATEHMSQWSISLFLFALLNGFYEELFFIGLLVLIEKKHFPWVILFSLMVRFAFHTYQGLAGAMVITTLGMVFLLLRWKSDELLPFMLAHSFFDVFGLGLPLYLLE
ncbi:CPBP family intramembrane metalloprotease [Wielerella bovis]|uniref:CPBP family intramembrane glutamic endopeptidase n=1 Tax=Wielerella bovis TaxID=2917790 RepID=UPI0020188C80|nr:CPBP family intramembrane glutamic endopeptidase [Wielerella bovis]ULJ62906.1 CPBP family intramembrane metalloprotease [Wielerella bovis]